MRKNSFEETEIAGLGEKGCSDVVRLFGVMELSYGRGAIGGARTESARPRSFYRILSLCFGGRKPVCFSKGGPEWDDPLIGPVVIYPDALKAGACDYSTELRVKNRQSKEQGITFD